MLSWASPLASPHPICQPDRLGLHELLLVYGTATSSAQCSSEPVRNNARLEAACRTEIVVHDDGEKDPDTIKAFWAWVEEKMGQLKWWASEKLGIEDEDGKDENGKKQEKSKADQKEEGG